ncbi:hypothetical protein SC171_23760 [Pantoea cypripedii]
MAIDGRNLQTLANYCAAAADAMAFTLMRTAHSTLWLRRINGIPEKHSN